MRERIGWTWLLPLLAAGLLLGSARAAVVPPRLASGPKDTLVQIPVWSSTAQALRRSQLRLAAANPGTTLVKLQPPASPTFIFLVLDLSHAVSRITEIRQALRTAIQRLPAQTWVGIFGANDGLHVIQDPTQQRKVLQWEIESIYPSGHPGLLDAIEPVESIAGRVQRQGHIKVAVIAITDSNVYGYRSDYGDTTVNSSDTHDLSRRFKGRDLESKIQRMDRRLLEDRVPLFVVQVDNFPDALNRIYNNGLQRFCSTLGGDTWFVQSLAEIQPDIQAAFTRVSQFYLATLKTPPPGHEVDLSLTMGGVALDSSDYRHRLVTTRSDH